MKSSVKHEKASEQLIWDMACRHLKKVLSEREISQWLSGYELRNIEEDKAVLLCRNGNCKGENQEKYLRELEKSLSWAAGKPLQLYIEMAGSHAGRIHRTGKKKNCLKKITVAVILMVIFGGLAMGAQTLRLSRPHKTFYRIVSDKMEDGFRIVLLSDLKGSSFGDANEELLESVRSLKPDLILLSGDMWGNNYAGAAEFCRQLVDIAETCYVFEENGTSNMNLETELNEAGIRVLADSSETFTVQNETIEIYGDGSGEKIFRNLYSRPSFQEFLNQNSDGFKILVSSDPYIYSSVSNERLPDLLLTGHTLGGGIRLPYVGAIYDSYYGFFPERQEKTYIYGEYSINESALIVSGGLSKEKGLRFNDRLELVVVDVSRY